MEKLGLINKKKTKFIFSFLSGVFYGLGQGALMGSGGIAVYILSYIHHKDDWVDMPYGNLMSHFIILFNALFSPLSSILEKLCGPEMSLLISSIIVEICLFLFYIQRNIWIFYAITVLAGLGVGLSANITLKNACLYYPEKKGLISACIVSLSGIGSAIYILVGEQLINPLKEGVIDAKTDPYYSIEVSENVKYYFIFAMIVLPIGTILALLFFYKYDPNCENEGKENESEINEGKENSLKKEEDSINENDKKSESNSLNTSYSKNTKKVLKSFRFWRIVLIGGAMPFWIYFVHSSYRPYVVMLGVDTEIIFYLGSVLTIIGYLFGPIWAILVDKFGFQPIMKIIGLICCLMTIYFYFFMDHPLLYPIGLIFTCSSIVGIIAAFTPHLMQVYGFKYFLTIGGFARLFVEIFRFIAGLASIIFSIFFKNAHELLLPYEMIVAFGGILTIIGFILIFKENDDKFNYGDENENFSSIIVPDNATPEYRPLENIN